MFLIGKISVWMLVLIAGFTCTWHNKNASPGGSMSISSTLQVVSRISVLSIHVCDTLVHDSVFHFLAGQLGLPVEYHPVKLGDRKYAGIYTGNLFLEPCGPFRNFRYARDHFKAAFYGLNCESERSLSSIAQDLRERKINFKQNSSIVIIDTSITMQNMYFSISQRKSIAKIKGKEEMAVDSLNEVMKSTVQRSAGIEGIKEVWIGFSGKSVMSKWNDLVNPAVISETGIWRINEDQSIRFVKSDKTEVMAIVFKVRSLEKAKHYLMDKKLLGKSDRDFIEIDSSKAYGLMIYLSEK